MLLDLKFSVGTLGLATGTFIAGLYGMNLKNYLEEAAVGFGGVTAFSVVLSIVVCGYGLVKLRKVQRVKMSVGDAASAGRGGLMARDDVSAKIVDDRVRERVKRQRALPLGKGKWGKGRKERWAL
jgi:magnesium transporter